MRWAMGHGQVWSGLIRAACGAQKGGIGVNPDGMRWRQSGGTYFWDRS